MKHSRTKHEQCLMTAKVKIGKTSKAMPSEPIRSVAKIKLTLDFLLHLRQTTKSDHFAVDDEDPFVALGPQISTAMLLLLRPFGSVGKAASSLARSLTRGRGGKRRTLLPAQSDGEEEKKTDW